MNPRERYINTLLFGKPDRIPLQPGVHRESTRAVWYEQGLPRNIPDIDIEEYAYREAGGQKEWPRAFRQRFPVSDRMIPQFEEKVLERRERTQVVQDWKGNICEIGNEFTPRHLRDPIDFVTRRWISCPVKSREDWEDMKRRYDADTPERFPSDVETLSGQLKDRDYTVEIVFGGPFWQLREWLGAENLFVMFYDDPEFIKEMLAFWEDYIARLLENTFRWIVPDQVGLTEDMAYKSFSMLSPKMVREFILPTYQRWGEIIRNAGCPIYFVDSDGHVGELIPIWMEAGINACGPIEVAAGNDIVEFRRRFGRGMAYIGGVDKQAMAKGGKVIEEEIERLRPVIEDGGYIPECDHGVPSDISWPNYVHYTGLLAKATGWM